MQLLKISGLLILLMTLQGMASAASDKSDLADSIVAINWDGQRNAAAVTGVVVRSDRYNGYVVAPASFPASLTRLTVTLPGTGAELVAQPIARDSSINLALLKVNGLGMPPVKLNLSEPTPGDVVWAFSAPDVVDRAALQTVGVTRGELQGLQGIQGEIYLHHTASFVGISQGAALLNECGELLGINFMLDGAARALSSRAVAAFVQSQNIAITTTATSCVSPLQDAKARAEQATIAAAAARDEALAAQAIAKQMAVRVAANDERNQQLLAEAAKAQQTAEAAIAAAREAQQHAEQTRVELEKQAASLAAETDALIQQLKADRAAAERSFRQTLEAQRREATAREDFLLTALAGLFVLTIIALGVMVRFGIRPSTIVEQIKPKAEAPPRPVAPAVVESPVVTSQYILEGRDEDAIRYLLQFSEGQAKSKQGVVIGRNPAESEFVINHIDVSRQHARIKMHNNQIFIEDLGATNSTLVNNEDIAGKGPVAINAGDQILFGAVQMTLRIKATKEVISK